MQTKSAFVICTVRDADDVFRKKIEAYKAKLEEQGYVVYLPHLHTDQEASGYEICYQNMTALWKAEEVHIFFNPKSIGSHFDLGMAFLAHHLYGKPIKVVENLEAIEYDGQMKMLLFKSFGQMLQDWERKQRKGLFKKNPACVFWARIFLWVRKVTSPKFH